MALARKIRVTVSEASINKEAATFQGVKSCYTVAPRIFPPQLSTDTPHFTKKTGCVTSKIVFRRVQLPPPIKGCRVLMTLNDTRGKKKEKGKIE